jgi:hypothetical protein
MCSELIMASSMNKHSIGASLVVGAGYVFAAKPKRVSQHTKISYFSVPWALSAQPAETQIMLIKHAMMVKTNPPTLV